MRISLVGADWSRRGVGPCWRLALVACLAGLLSASTAAPTAAYGADHVSALAQTTARIGRDARLRRLLKSMVAQANAPGGVLLVQTPTSTWRRAVGAAQLARSVSGPRDAKRLPMRVNSRFRLGSVTKTFTAALVLRLVTERNLSLDDTVERWLPSRLPNGAGSRITIRDLLGHRSGIHDQAETEQMVVAGPPGVFYYANSNYDLLGDIVATATSSTYAEQLSLQILRPLALTNTEIATWAQVPAGLARGYSAKPVSRSVPRLDFTNIAYAPHIPAAGLVSSAADLARFERSLFTGSLIPPALVALMQTPGSVVAHETYGFNAYGLGLERFPARCGPAWGHRGRAAGYMTYLLSNADGRRTVVLQINDTPDSPLVPRLDKLVTQALCA